MPSPVRPIGRKPRPDPLVSSSENLLDHVGVKQDLEELLGVRVDVVTRRGLHPLMREHVLAEAVAV